MERYNGLEEIFFFTIVWRRFLTSLQEERNNNCPGQPTTWIHGKMFSTSIFLMVGSHWTRFDQNNGFYTLQFFFNGDNFKSQLAFVEVPEIWPLFCETLSWNCSWWWRRTLSGGFKTWFKSFRGWSSSNLNQSLNLFEPHHFFDMGHNPLTKKYHIITFSSLIMTVKLQLISIRGETWTYSVVTKLISREELRTNDSHSFFCSHSTTECQMFSRRIYWNWIIF